jgi:hypothetical protein
MAEIRLRFCKRCGTARDPAQSPDTPDCPCAVVLELRAEVEQLRALVEAQRELLELQHKALKEHTHIAQLQLVTPTRVQFVTVCILPPGKAPPEAPPRETPAPEAPLPKPVFATAKAAPRNAEASAKERALAELKNLIGLRGG